MHATYGGEDRLGGTGQGNLSSVSMRVAQSCIIFKFLEFQTENNIHFFEIKGQYIQPPNCRRRKFIYRQSIDFKLIVFKQSS